MIAPLVVLFLVALIFLWLVLKYYQWNKDAIRRSGSLWFSFVIATITAIAGSFSSKHCDGAFCIVLGVILFAIIFGPLLVRGTKCGNVDQAYQAGPKAMGGKQKTPLTEQELAVLVRFQRSRKLCLWFFTGPLVIGSVLTILALLLALFVFPPLGLSDEWVGLGAGLGALLVFGGLLFGFGVSRCPVCRRFLNYLSVRPSESYSCPTCEACLQAPKLV